jgi:hypothetical protein
LKSPDFGRFATAWFGSTWWALLEAHPNVKKLGAFVCLRIACIGNPELISVPTLMDLAV